MWLLLSYICSSWQPPVSLIFLPFRIPSTNKCNDTSHDSEEHEKYIEILFGYCTERLWYASVFGLAPSSFAMQSCLHIAVGPRVTGLLSIVHLNPLIYICLRCCRQPQDFAIPGVQAAKSCLSFGFSWVNPSRNGQCTSKDWAQYPVKRAKTVSNLKHLFRQVSALAGTLWGPHVSTHGWHSVAWVLIYAAGSIVVGMRIF